MQTQKFSLRKRARSFHYAFRGLFYFFSTTHNAIIHAIATAAVFTLAMVIKLPLSKLLFVIVVTGLVWMAELFNTAVERICDMVYPGKHPKIKFIKDLAAAAVLVAALTAFITACVIFIPALL